MKKHVRSTLAPRADASRTWLRCLGVALVIQIQAATAVADSGCTRPPRPLLPDGARATLDDMLAGQKAVKAFQAANRDYMKCLETRFTAVRANAEAPDAAVRALAQAEYGMAIDAYNAAVSAEEEIAGAFNIELREFKAANR